MPDRLLHAHESGSAGSQAARLPTASVAAAEFADARPAALAHKNLQDLASNSSQAKSLAAFQRKADLRPPANSAVIQCAFQYLYPADVIVDRGRPLDDIKAFHALQGMPGGPAWSRDGVQVYTQDRNIKRVEERATEGNARTSNLVKVSDDLQWEVPPAAFNKLKQNDFLRASGGRRAQIFNSSFRGELSMPDELSLPLGPCEARLDTPSRNANNLWKATRTGRHAQADLGDDQESGQKGSASAHVAAIHDSWDAEEPSQAENAWPEIYAMVNHLTRGKNAIYLPMLSVLVNELQARQANTLYVKALIHALDQQIAAGVTRKLPKKIETPVRASADQRWGEMTGMGAASEAFNDFLPEPESTFLATFHSRQAGSSDSDTSVLAKNLWRKMNIPEKGRKYYGEPGETKPTMTQINALIHQHAFTYSNLYLSNVAGSVSGKTGMPKVRLYRREKLDADTTYHHRSDERQMNATRAPLESWSHAGQTKGIGDAWTTTLGTLMPISHVLISYLQARRDEPGPDDPGPDDPGPDDPSGYASSILLEGESEFFAAADPSAVADLGYLNAPLDQVVKRNDPRSSQEQVRLQLNRDRSERYVARQTDALRVMTGFIPAIEADIQKIEAMQTSLEEMDAIQIQKGKFYNQAVLTAARAAIDTFKNDVLRYKDAIAPMEMAIRAATSAEALESDHIEAFLVFQDSNASTIKAETLKMLNTLTLMAQPPEVPVNANFGSSALLERARAASKEAEEKKSSESEDEWSD